jgi:hypothetical protein
MGWVAASHRKAMANSSPGLLQPGSGNTQRFFATLRELRSLGKLQLSNVVTSDDGLAISVTIPKAKLVIRCDNAVQTLTSMLLIHGQVGQCPA